MRETAIERPLGGEVRKFGLPLGRQRKVEERCGYGLGRVYGRLSTVLFADDPRGWDFSINDYRETIYQALMGGGLSDAEATKLVIEAVDGCAVKASVILAAEILSAWMLGLPPAKKAKPGRTKATPAGA